MYIGNGNALARAKQAHSVAHSSHSAHRPTQAQPRNPTHPFPGTWIAGACPVYPDSKSLPKSHLSHPYSPTSMTPPTFFLNILRSSFLNIWILVVNSESSTYNSSCSCSIATIFKRMQPISISSHLFFRASRRYLCATPVQAPHPAPPAMWLQR